MKRLIANADDFGLTNGVNRGIIDGHVQGIITSASLMPNMPAFDDAVVLAKQNPRLGVGVHLTLINGSPITDPSLVPSIVDKKGAFFDRPFLLIKKLIARRVKLHEIELELRGQTEKVLKALGRITHLDTHKHLHAYPRIFTMVLSIAHHYRIKYVRYPFERRLKLRQIWKHVHSAKIIKQYLTSRLIASASLLAKRRVNSRHTLMTNNFVGLTHTGFLNTSLLKQIILSLPEGTTELMCHPGYVTEELMKVPTRLVGHRELELKALMNPEVLRLVEAKNIQLSSYLDLEHDSKP